MLFKYVTMLRCDFYDLIIILIIIIEPRHVISNNVAF